jgi:hypothetical protein
MGRRRPNLQRTFFLRSKTYSLLQAGIKSIIFEKDASQARERDWNMGLHWGVPILKSLMPDDMWSQIPSIQPDPHMLNNDDVSNASPNGHPL